MTDHQDRAGETAPLQALSEQWREEALRLEMRGRRVAAERNKEHADQLDAALSRLSASPADVGPAQEQLAFVAVMNALDIHMPPDGQDLLDQLRQIAATAGYPWRGRVTQAANIGPQAQGICRWEEDSSGDYWVPACEGGELFQFNDGGPVENHMRHCPYCGLKVQVPGTVSQAQEKDQ